MMVHPADRTQGARLGADDVRGAAARSPAARIPGTATSGLPMIPSSMSTIDEAAEFFGSFFDAEYQTRKANLEGSPTFGKLYKKVQSMLGEPTVLELRQIDVADTKKESNQNALKALTSRELFLIEEHKVGRRTLYCGKASDTRRPNDFTTFAMAFWADDSLKIIATFIVCSSCEGAGPMGGAPCGDCDGAGWTRKTGERLKPSRHVAIKKLCRPTWPQAAEIYDQR